MTIPKLRHIAGEIQLKQEHLQEDAEEYEEEEFELLNVAVSPVIKIKAEYTPRVIRLRTQPAETIRIGMQDG